VRCTWPKWAGSNDPPKRPMTMPLVAIGKPLRTVIPFAAAQPVLAGGPWHVKGHLRKREQKIARAVSDK
jgi:hypothetical protein